MNKFAVILTTVPTIQIGKAIAENLLEARLAACVQVSNSPVLSLYSWKGKRESSEEFQVWIKASAHHFQKIARAIQAIHPYETPEIISLPIQEGLKSYLLWLQEESIQEDSTSV